MVDATVTFLLEKLWHIGETYVNLLTEDKKELKGLENDLRSLKAFLLDAAKKPNKEEFYKETERQIRELVYDAEDTIDTRLTEANVAKSKKSQIKELFGKNTKNRITLAQEVIAVRERVRPMLEKAQRFARTEIAEGAGRPVEGQWTGVRMDQSIRQEKIVGFEDEEKTLTDYLKQQNKKLDVISIIGLPGLGKTTLAWKIFQRKDISFEFPVRIWVCVSQTFSKKEVFLKILSKIDDHDLSSLDEDDLRQRIHERLSEAKFLLVLDDVWTTKAWSAIKVVLPESNYMSKVLITSRYTGVGLLANCSRVPHNLRFLTEDESWQLLQLEVFGDVGACPNQDLERLGDSIAKKCKGLPLAIVVIGGILLAKYSNRPMDRIIVDWTDVDDNLNTYLVRNNNVQDISKIVEWSYSLLPSVLRDCFLYLGVFPEDYDIPAWMLTRLWIAEGFLQKEPGFSSLEKTAEMYLEDLVDRNLVMVANRDPNDKVKICRVHDVIRFFCISRAAIKEQNLFQEITLSKGVFNPTVQDIHEYRRLCIHQNLPQFLSREPKGPHVRSLLCFNKAAFELDASCTPQIPDSFKLLRVLETKSIKFKRFPDRFPKLIYLRYITLFINNLDAFLPEEISGLCNLETLVVDTNSATLRILANIWRMNKLRHVKTDAAIVLAFKEEGTSGDNKLAENLQTFSRLSPDYVEKVLKKAISLKILGVRGKLATLFNIKSLRTWDAIEKLKLVNELNAGSESKLQFDLPPQTWFPRNLNRLTISATYLEWTHMSVLGKIESLQVLKLEDNAFNGREWKICDGFISLHFLLIANAEALAYWDASTGHFPKLRSLVLSNCRNLKAIPLCLGTTLQRLDIENLSKPAVDSARKIEEKKKQAPKQQNARLGGEFKLIIGPGCEK